MQWSILYYLPLVTYDIIIDPRHVFRSLLKLRRFVLRSSVFLMLRRPPISTRTDTLFPYTTLFRSREFASLVAHWQGGEPDKLAAEMNESLEATPELAQVLLIQRNANWADRKSVV